MSNSIKAQELHNWNHYRIWCLEIVVFTSLDIISPRKANLGTDERHVNIYVPCTILLMELCLIMTRVDNLDSLISACFDNFFWIQNYFTWLLNIRKTMWMSQYHILPYVPSLHVLHGLDVSLPDQMKSYYKRFWLFLCILNTLFWIQTRLLASTHPFWTSNVYICLFVYNWDV